MANEQFIVCADVDAAVRAAQKRCLSALTSEQGESRSIALAGGSTPKRLYTALAQSLPNTASVQLDMVEWFFGDERCVSPDHMDSNYRMACDAMLTPMGIAPGRTHRMEADADDLDAAARSYEQQLRQAVSGTRDGCPVLDLVLLGLGDDGHTASLFPGSAGLSEQDRLVVAHQVPRLDAMRMTLTYPVLQAAREVVFLVTGDGKAEVLSRILSKANDSDLPAAALRPGGSRETRGSLVWILDNAAARLVKSARNS